MSITRVEDIGHVRFAAPDLAEMRRFLEEFGLSCFERDGRLYGRGSDGAPFAHVTERGEAAFLGLGLRLADRESLERLADSEGARVEPFDAPGGGWVVRLRDPDGNAVEAVAGQAWDEAGAHVPESGFNSAALRRRLRSAVRLAQGPSRVRRLGHAVLNVADFRRSERWYKERFGFITSDEIEAAPGVALGAFMRCDRGDQPTDHHTLFLAQLPGGPGFNHAAFEVAGLDDLMLGHAHLKARGRNAALEWDGTSWAARSSITGRIPGGTNWSIGLTAICSPPRTDPTRRPCATCSTCNGAARSRRSPASVRRVSRMSGG